MIPNKYKVAFLTPAALLAALTICAPGALAQSTMPPSGPRAQGQENNEFSLSLPAPSLAPDTTPVPYSDPEAAALAANSELLGKKFHAACSPYLDKQIDVCLEEIKEKFKKTRAWRIIYPHSLVTLEYSPSRLNIILDKDGYITEIKIG